MSKKLDPRVVRTRRWLRRALIELVTERGYQDVMVQDITDRAELNRATFYLHYKDKDDLLNDCARELFEDVIRRIEVHKGECGAKKLYMDDPALLVPAFEHFAEYADFYRVVLGENGVQSFATTVRAYYSELVQDNMRHKMVDAPPALLESLAQFNAAGILGMVTWWLDHDMPQPPAVMADYLLKMLEGMLHVIQYTRPVE